MTPAVAAKLVGTARAANYCGVGRAMSGRAFNACRAGILTAVGNLKAVNVREGTPYSIRGTSVREQTEFANS